MEVTGRRPRALKQSGLTYTHTELGAKALKGEVKRKVRGLKLRPESKLGYIIVREPVRKRKTRECCGRECHGAVGRETYAERER